MKMNDWKWFWFSIFLSNVLYSCVSHRSNKEYYTLEEPAKPYKMSTLGFSKKYGTNSECLVLMQGPVPSRLEPCVVGDVRSGTMMYKETEVTVTGETAQFEWQMTGMVYSPFVNEAYYQSQILFKGSFFRKTDYHDYRRYRGYFSPPYLSRPSYYYPRHNFSPKGR